MGNRPWLKKGKYLILSKRLVWGKCIQNVNVTNDYGKETD